MEIQGDSNTCNVAYLVGISSLSYDYSSGSLIDSYENSTYIQSFDKFKENLLKAIKTYDYQMVDKVEDDGRDIYHWSCQCIHRMSCLIAYTVNTQKTGERNLEELGFKRVAGPISKIKHSGGKLSVWIIKIPELMDAVGYEGVIPRDEIEKQWDKAEVPYKKRN